MSRFSTRKEETLNIDYYKIHQLMNGRREIMERVPAKQQRELFGKSLGKGQIYINLDTDELSHYVQKAYGAYIEATAMYDVWTGEGWNDRA